MTCPSCGAQSEPAAEVCFSCRSVLAVVSRGTLLGARYEIHDRLGRGGMGTVYRAHDRVLDEDVAIKVLHADLAAAPDMAERFLSEIKLARRVSHRNVCRIHEYGDEGRVRFISMELVDGMSLKDLLQGGPLPATEVYDAVEQAARGLAAIHEVGIVHRDLKPANLTRDSSGRVRVMDFGIAKAAGVKGDTTAGYLLGSPEYMSPEQARGRGADLRSDLYALGVVTFELFTGAPPFRGDTPVATLLLHLEAAPPLNLPGSAVPPAVVPVLRRALAKDPRERQQSARQLADELRAAASGGAPSVASGSRPRRVNTGARSWVGRLSIVAALGALVASWSVGPGAREPTPAASPAAPAPSTPMPTISTRPTPDAPAVGPLPQLDPIASPQSRVESRTVSKPPLASPPPSPTPLAGETAHTESSTPAPRPPPPVPEPTPGPPDGSATAAAPGFLLVVVSPWADVTVDGKPAGQTPLARLSLAPGPHTVRLHHPEYQPYPRKIVVRSGETIRLAVDLSQDGVRIRP
jgi:serine/threonine protein kinase